MPARTRHLPRDLAVRERLRDAQHAETAALAAVDRAGQHLTDTEAKRRAALDAADAVVDQARARLAATQRALIEISGLDRAAALLDTTTRALRRTSTDRNGSSR